MQKAVFNIKGELRPVVHAAGFIIHTRASVLVPVARCPDAIDAQLYLCIAIADLAVLST
jgi:hypothetical protein